MLFSLYIENIPFISREIFIMHLGSNNAFRRLLNGKFVQNKPRYRPFIYTLCKQTVEVKYLKINGADL